MDIALHWIMVHMFQFAVLGCFTLLYALIVLILVIRLCAPLVREGRKEEGEEGEEGTKGEREIGRRGAPESEGAGVW
jgi:hypothetical protein